MFTSINPATGKPGQSHAELTDAQVEGRLAKAHAAFLDWRTSELDERTALLRRIAEGFENDKERLGADRDRRNGQDAQVRDRRGREMRLGVPLLCQERAQAARTDRGRHARRPCHRALAADGAGARGDAVEFSLLASDPLCRAGDHGGQCRAVEARLVGAGLRRGDRGDRSSRPARPRGCSRTSRSSPTRSPI